MKTFAFILSLYILALSIVPCGDGMLHGEEEHNHTTEVATGDNEHNHSEHKDHCTPFCVCACCGTMIAMPTIHAVSFAKEIQTANAFQFHYTFNYSFDFSKGIWHPPSLS